MVEDEWRVVPGYEYYEVTRDGRVRSIKRSITYENGRTVRYQSRLLTKRLNNKGYLYYAVRQPNMPHKLYAHRAVALAYIPNPDKKPCVNHIDNDPLNNNVENLEWCTKQENTDWMAIQGRNKRTKEWLDNLHEGQRKFFKPVISTDIVTGEKKIYERLNAVRKDGYCPSNVCTVIKNGRKYYKGKMWSYFNE